MVPAILLRGFLVPLMLVALTSSTPAPPGLIAPDTQDKLVHYGHNERRIYQGSGRPLNKFNPRATSGKLSLSLEYGTSGQHNTDDDNDDDDHDDHNYHGGTSQPESSSPNNDGSCDVFHTSSVNSDYSQDDSINISDGGSHDLHHGGSQDGYESGTLKLESDTTDNSMSHDDSINNSNSGSSGGDGESTTLGSSQGEISDSDSSNNGGFPFGSLFGGDNNSGETSGSNDDNPAGFPFGNIDNSGKDSGTTFISEDDMAGVSFGGVFSGSNDNSLFGSSFDDSNSFSTGTNDGDSFGLPFGISFGDSNDDRDNGGNSNASAQGSSTLPHTVETQTTNLGQTTPQPVQDTIISQSTHLTTSQSTPTDTNSMSTDRTTPTQTTYQLRPSNIFDFSFGSEVEMSNKRDVFVKEPKMKSEPPSANMKARMGGQPKMRRGLVPKP